MHYVACLPGLLYSNYQYNNTLFIKKNIGKVCTINEFYFCLYKKEPNKTNFEVEKTIVITLIELIDFQDISLKWKTNKKYF